MKPTQCPPILAQSSGLPCPHIPHDEREALIAEAAYFRAEKRGFTPGHEVEDWLAAERKIAHWLLSLAA